MKKYIAEALGTGLLAFTAVTTEGDQFAIAAILAICIYAYAGVSGAHFNLSVTTAMWSRGEISCGEVIKYAVAQIAGAVIAIAVALALKGGSVFNFGVISAPIGADQVVNEFLAGAILLTAIFTCMRHGLHPAWGVALAHIVLVPFGWIINTSITLASFTNGNALILVLVLAVVQIAGGIFASKLDNAISK